MPRGAGPVPDHSAEVQTGAPVSSSDSDRGTSAVAEAPLSEAAPPPLFNSALTHLNKRGDVRRNVSEETPYGAFVRHKGEKENVNESCEEEEIRGARAISYHT